MITLHMQRNLRYVPEGSKKDACGGCWQGLSGSINPFGFMYFLPNVESSPLQGGSPQSCVWAVELRTAHCAATGY